MTSLAHWIEGARPRTLPAAISPVLVGTGAASAAHDFRPLRALLALLVALALQVGVNYANDYSDGIRGTDSTEKRVGPVRLVGQRLAAPSSVKRAAFAAFGVAALAGGALAIVVGPELFVVGALSILAGWFYTGGSRPYGYAGFGELFVFVFFGLVATAGSSYVQIEHVTGLSLGASVPVGLLATSLLVVNNLRDIPGDTVAGKRTLAVVAGDQRTRLLYAVCVLLPFAVAVAIAPVRPLALIALAAVPLAVPPIRLVRGGAMGPKLIAALGQTGRLQLAFGALLTIGLAIRA